MLDIAVIGAGPYGLSIAAHLAKTKVKSRAFGSTMQTWREQMPQAGHMKSEGFASSLSDPGNEFPLSSYCRDHGIPYADIGLPMKRQIFTAYGEAFARRYVPQLEDRQLAKLERGRQGFELTFADGGKAAARRVVCAVGISHYCYLPEPYLQMPRELVSHSSSHTEFSRFAGKTVAVIGAGASATECAALLAQAGADTHLITRRAAVEFHEPPRRRSLKDKLRAPRTPLGTGWDSVFLTHTPLMFHALSAKSRMRIVRQFAGPAACWFMRDRIETTVTMHTSAQVSRLVPSANGITLHLTGAGTSTLDVDHVIAATGYRVDLGRLNFLRPEDRQKISCLGGGPVLSRNFESTLPGLYFAGPSAANSFGPLQRFACGARFAAQRISRIAA